MEKALLERGEILIAVDMVSQWLEIAIEYLRVDLFYSGRDFEPHLIVGHTRVEVFRPCVAVEFENTSTFNSYFKFK